MGCTCSVVAAGPKWRQPEGQKKRIKELRSKLPIRNLLLYHSNVPNLGERDGARSVVLWCRGRGIWVVGSALPNPFYYVACCFMLWTVMSWVSEFLGMVTVRLLQFVLECFSGTPLREPGNHHHVGFRGAIPKGSSGGSVSTTLSTSLSF
jgi:hypothetical protein